MLLTHTYIVCVVGLMGMIVINIDRADSQRDEERGSNPSRVRPISNPRPVRPPPIRTDTRPAAVPSDGDATRPVSVDVDDTRSVSGSVDDDIPDRPPPIRTATRRGSVDVDDTRSVSGSVEADIPDRPPPIQTATRRGSVDVDDTRSVSGSVEADIPDRPPPIRTATRRGSVDVDDTRSVSASVEADGPILASVDDDIYMDAEAVQGSMLIMASSDLMVLPQIDILPEEESVSCRPLDQSIEPFFRTLDEWTSLIHVNLPQEEEADPNTRPHIRPVITSRAGEDAPTSQPEEESTIVSQHRVDSAMRDVDQERTIVSQHRVDSAMREVDQESTIVSQHRVDSAMREVHQERTHVSPDRDDELEEEVPSEDEMRALRGGGSNSMDHQDDCPYKQGYSTDHSRCCPTCLRMISPHTIRSVSDQMYWIVQLSCGDNPPRIQYIPDVRCLSGNYGCSCAIIKEYRYIYVSNVHPNSAQYPADYLWILVNLPRYCACL